MPETYREELLLEGILEHPPVERPSRVLHYLPQGNVLELVQKHQGKRVLVVLEEVKEAAELYQKLRGKGFSSTTAAWRRGNGGGFLRRSSAGTRPRNPTS